jgi:hypothetical protein
MMSISGTLEKGGVSAMHLEVAPETERLVRQEINSGHFRTVDEPIAAGVQAWREKNAPLIKSSAAPEAQASNLVVLFEPVRGLFEDGEIDFSRNQSGARPVNLE